MKTASDTTLVHTQETTGENPAYESYRAYRQSLHADEFAAVEQLYSTTDERDETKRLELLQGCRAQAWFVRDKNSGAVHVASNSCRLRWCPMCGAGKAAFITHNVREWIESQQHPRFLTLTLKHSNAPLDTQITKLYADFRKLRKDTQFKKLCVGGVWFFQIKLSKDTQQWHPHLHCVLVGKYIPHEWLSCKWKYITTSSNIVDIRMVRDPEKMANEVARYSARPAQMKDYPDFLRTEIFDAMHGRRLCGTWGVGKAVTLSPPRSVDESQFENLGSWAVVQGQKDYDDRARAILRAWKTDQPLAPGIKMTGIDAFIDDLPSKLTLDEDGKYYYPGLLFQ